MTLRLFITCIASAAALVAPCARPRPPTRLLAADRERLVQTVERLGGKVTAGDVAGEGAASLVSAERELLALAARLGDRASLAVADDGRLVFDFPRKTANALAAADGREKWLQRWEKAKPGVYTAGRIAFGVSLFASLAVGATILSVLSAAAEGEQGQQRQSRGRSTSFVSPYGLFGPSPFDVFYYRPYYGARYRGRDARGGDEMNFLEAVYSYVFGDGDPNADVDRRALQAAAAIVRENDGAVVAEQLAPVLALPPPPGALEDATVVDEAFVLPIVAELDGRPTVDPDTGAIVYVFEELMASGRGRVEDVRGGGRGAGALEEAPVPFSRASGGQLAAAGLLGVANLGVAAAAAFYTTIGLTPAVLANLGPAGVAALRATAGPLLAYALAFNALPLARSSGAKRATAEAEGRNRARAAWADAVRKPAGGLRAKLSAARRFAPKLLGRGATVYSTDMEASDAEQAKVADDLAAFDRKLED
eukprot:CAMPEP_0119268064 /NCGR_PEP_ID=MMETSP1329-20130426/5969_1 /TAXON_ID=114041 /ORGANISM="Genus nov. species nov., Strain RCC1024" /LENGTH=478 /DNA_ID=CAMNT_0007268015 /DNA_START=204 /DNA_END=1640 /DNA_ORIENTATION=+